MSGLWLALALLAQDHAMMPGMAMPMPATPARAAPRKPAKARPKAKRPGAVVRPAKARAMRAASAKPAMSDMPAMVDGCSAEHAAMGHCTAAPAASAMPMPMPMDGQGEAVEAAGDPACPPEHAAMGHCTPAVTTQAAPAARSGTDLPAGQSAPPPPPATRAADAFYDPAAMARADRRMRQEHGGMTFSQVIFNLAEVQARRGRDGYRWDGEGWFGGDIDRLVVKSEGEGGFRDRVEAAEVQALYARAIDPYWNLQAGVRQDLGAGARRTHAVVGVEGLAPYWFDVEGALFLSDRGDLTARAEAWYDQRITQRLIAQPRVELNMSAQDVPGSRVGAGLSTAEAGLRLRYEIAREFAPYVGVSWERRYGATARYATARGDSTGGAALVIGIRGWF